MSKKRLVSIQSIDLKAELIVRDNTELLQALERIKAMQGVRDVMWSEPVETLDKKISTNSCDRQALSRPAKTLWLDKLSLPLVLLL
jgi:hypothetical protein